jgi:predicted nucleic acid-binding protein
MNVLVDTPVWSLVLRRERRDARKQFSMRMEMRELIATGRTVILGPIRQELLSGIRDGNTFQRLRDHLRDFIDEPLETEDFEYAAHCANVCGSGGIASSGVDMLLCSVAIRRDYSILTTDGDFAVYNQHLRFRLHSSSFGAPRKPK